MEKDNEELLDYVYQNAEMGVNSISKLMEIVDDSEFMHQLDTQKNEYTAMKNDAEKQLSERGMTEDDLSAFDRARTYIMINMQTIKDKSVSHIAQMLMQGSTMGIVQAIRKLREYTQVDEPVKNLMQKLLEMEERNFEQLKKYI